MMKRIQAKVMIFCLICAGIMLTNVHEMNAKKNRRPKEYLEGKSLFFGGAHLGVSMSQVDGDNFSGWNKYNLNFSATAYSKIDRTIAISTEVGYNTKGSRATGRQLPYIVGSGDTIQSYGITLGYAELAILGNVFDRKRNNAGAGLAYSRLVSSEEKANGAIETNYPFQKNALDLVLNGEVKLLKDYEFFLNFRFQYSILPVRKNYMGPFGRPEQVNKQILVRLGYIF